MYTSTMEDIARGVIAGIAIGGFTAVMVKVNMFVIDKLSMLNALAIDTAWEMSRTALENIKMRRRGRQLAADYAKKQQQLLQRAADEEEARLMQKHKELYQQADAIGVQLAVRKLLREKKLSIHDADSESDSESDAESKT